MSYLKVTEFSCINHAEIRTNKLTLLIGPQASGKSVLSKLIYFFQEFFINQYRHIEEGRNISEFKTEIREEFTKWFPVSAWGSRKFSIDYVVGDYSIRILRSQYGVVQDNIRVRVSAEFEAQYKSAQEYFQKVNNQAGKSDDLLGVSYRDLDITYDIRRRYEQAFIARLGADYAAYQLFIPAGRSFFTNIGRAIAAFEHSNILDPITLRFGRLFASLRERGVARPRLRRKPNQYREIMQKLMEEILGGKITFEKDKEFMRSEDGRQIPISALSSGQQELFPILLLLDNVLSVSAQRQRIFIEEPEAHLFPSAQSAIIKALTSIASSEDGSMELFMTTHSPYVLAQINNLIKAESIYNLASSEIRKKVTEIIPEYALIKSIFVNAYCIKDGEVVDIMNDELIDADYLDGISECLSEEFTSLLDLEEEIL